MVWNPGQQLFGGRYIIEKYLDEGGFGITYLARNPQSELRVIKTLREEILNHPAWIPHQNRLKQDFKDEALRLALCRHPHIVEVENVFNEGDLPCMAMEYIEGENLYQQIEDKGALLEAEALEYIRQIGDALTLVHQKGLLHRDLKPSNIMMRAGKAEAVLIDFGIARQFIPNAVLQHTESLTPGYAPPEQYAPDAERGEYIDVYALAATLYTLLTGDLPTPAPARLLHFPLQSPIFLNPNVSDRVNEAIMKGMALNYKSRPQSVQEWLDLLGVGIMSKSQAVVILTSPPYTSPSWKCVHDIPVISGEIALSPKGDIVASVGNSNIHLFSVNTKFLSRLQLIRTLTDHSDSINSVAFSSDGQMLASGSNDYTIKVWEVETGKLIRTLNGHSKSVNSVAFNSDGQILASASNDKTIKLWRVATGREIYTLTGHSKSVNSVAFNRDGQILASASLNTTIKLWRVATGREIYTLRGHSDSINSVSFSSDGRILASGSSDKTIKLWELLNWPQKIKVREIRTLTGHSDSINSVSFSGDGRVLASGSGETIKLWEVATGREIRTLTSHSDRVNYVAFSGDGGILISGSSDSTIKLWKVSTGRAIFTLMGHSDSINSVSFSNDGQILASGSSDSTIKLWKVSTGRAIFTLRGHSDSINSVTFSSDGQILASGSNDNTIKLWDVVTGKEICTLMGHSDSVNSLAFSSDGQILASGSKSELTSIYTSIKLWSVATGREIRSLSGHFSGVNSVAFSGDGQILASADNGNTIKLWDVAAGTQIYTLTGDSWYENYVHVNSVAFSSDGQILASGHNDTIELSEVATGREIGSLSHFDQVNSVAFSPDGGWLAAGDSSGNIKIWRWAKPL